MVIQDLMRQAGGEGGNMTVFKSIVKANHVLSDYYNIVVSISGGSDSDIVLDLIYRVNQCLNRKITYVWFDTGLEFEATKRHLEFLEKKYDIEIIREKAVKPIPIACREYGQPFINKRVSEFLYRLQLHDFKFEDRPYEELIQEYPNCQSALQWWCNTHGDKANGKPSMLGIANNKYLKEFIVANPPTFKIANKCCYYAKKKVAHQLVESYDADLSIVGIRKAEGGARAAIYKTCYSDNGLECSTFRPIFWYSDKDKQFYEKKFGVTHSDCYTKYGMPRTGCAGCPFAQKLDDELRTIQEHEPKLYKAVNHIFGDSYEYTKRYHEFCEQHRSKPAIEQIPLFDIESGE